MLLLEADGKDLFRSVGIAVPESIRVGPRDAEFLPPGQGPWVVKAQVPVSGRGKAGGVIIVSSPDEVRPAAAALLGTTIKGCTVNEALVEEAIRGDECYLALTVDASVGEVRLLYIAEGGVEVESASAVARFDEVFLLEQASADAAIDSLGATLPATRRTAVTAAAHRLAELFFRERLLLAEINPLFICDGHAVAGDAKIVVDMNVVATRPMLRALIENERASYPDAARKLAEDFDFVEIDPLGRIGLVTTGAGLSMMLIDELWERGLVPYNFCDVRTGQMRGSPARLLRILDWLSAAANVRVVLVNVFAGITDLGEFAQLLVDALALRPDFRQPVIARLVGNGEAVAAKIIAAHPERHIELVGDLEQAIERVAALLSHGLAGTTHAA